MSNGLMAVKLGMSQKFDENGKHIPVTLLKINDNVILGKKENKVVLGTGAAKEKNVNKAQKVFHQKNNLPFVKHVKEFKSDNEGLELGQALNAEFFTDIKFVDVTSQTKGRGFAGAIKRHNFRRNRVSHGCSLGERKLGSTGQCQDPGKVFKGKKMHGHYGDAQRTIQNLVVVDIDRENNILFVKGAVPGAKGGLVIVKKAIKKGGK